MFKLQDYSWSDHGFDLVGRFYSTAAGLLDDEFNIAFTMTDRQCVLRLVCACVSLTRGRAG